VTHTFVYSKLWHAIGILLIATIITLSVMSKPPVTMDFRFGDKVGHFIAYFSLMGWYTQIIRDSKIYWLLAVAFAAMGLGIEVIQGMGTSRYFEWADAGANTLGVIVAALLGLTGFRFWLEHIEKKLFV
jgi:hypothetical protein